MNAKGFTVVEVIVAIMILSVGLLGLASSAALVSRMIGEGGNYNESATIATQRMEILRSQAVPGTRCADVAGGSARDGSYQVAWQVQQIANGNAVRARVMVTVPRASQSARVDTFTTTIPCL